MIYITVCKYLQEENYKTQEVKEEATSKASITTATSSLPFPWGAKKLVVPAPGESETSKSSFLIPFSQAPPIFNIQSPNQIKPNLIKPFNSNSTQFKLPSSSKCKCKSFDLGRAKSSKTVSLTPSKFSLPSLQFLSILSFYLIYLLFYRTRETRSSHSILSFCEHTLFIAYIFILLQ